MNKPEFHDEYISPHRDPLSPSHQDFDYDAIARGLGEPAEPDKEERLENSADEMRALLQFLLGEKIGPKSPQQIFGRLISLAKQVCPEQLAGKEILVKECARMLRPRK